MAKNLNFQAPPALAIAEGAAAPDPGIVGVSVWSTTLGKPVYWTGAAWTAGAAGGGAPAGATGAVQFNIAGSFAGAAGVFIVGGNLNLAVATPGVAPANTITAFAQTVAGRMMLAMRGPAGVETGLQPFLARGCVGFWRPAGSSTAAAVAGGYLTPTIVGVATSRVIATTNFFTRLKRIGYVSAATVASLVESRVAAAQISIGDGAGFGGFTKIVRFGISDAAPVGTARMFVGISSNTGAATNVEPSTLTNSIGVGHGAADTTLKLYFGGSAAQAPIDLGANFPVNTRSTDAYELALFAAPNSTSVSYLVTRLNTGQSASGLLTAATAGLQLPAPAILLSQHKAWRTNNATALAVGLDLISDYIETDN